ncbi:hypothetical protein, partial [Tenacibaculum maritimum]
MKNIFFILIIFSLNAYAQKNILYVVIESKNNSLFKFEKNNSFSSIKILKNEYRRTGFINQKKSKKYDNDIIIVKTQPVRKRYYEFQSYKKPKTVSSISDLKTYSIKDISKNIEIFKESWGNHKYSIVFIEKVNCNYKLWEMKPIY